MSFFTWSADKNGGSVARFKTSSSCSILFPIYLKLRILYKHLLSNLFFINILRFLGQIFLVRKRWVHETVSSTRITGAGTNPSLKKIGKTPSSHIIHSPEGEHCWRVRDSKPIRLLESPRSLSGYIVMSHVWCPTSVVRNPMFDVRCSLSDVWCPTSDARCPISMCDVRCLMSGQRTRQKTGQRSKQEIGKKTDKKRGKRSTKIRTKNRTKDRTKNKRNDRTKKWDEKTEHYMAAWVYEFYLRVLKVSLTRSLRSLVRDAFSARRENSYPQAAMKCSFYFIDTDEIPT